MCGRYAFDDIKDIYEARKILEDIASRLGSDAAQSVKTGEVFPSEAAAVVAQTTGSKEGYQADVMKWGFPLSGRKQLVINARSETVLYTNMFRNSVAQKKCLIPCTGFYEWKSAGNKKERYIIRPYGQEFFYLAGLYDSFEAAGETKNRFVILTAAANADMKEIHYRMPVMIQKPFAKTWLEDSLSSQRLKQICAMTGKLSIERA